MKRLKSLLSFRNRAASLPKSHDRREIAIVEALEQRIAPATFTVANVNDSGAGSLRQAITDANALTGTDNIVFGIVGPAGLFTIQPLTPLPEITDAVIIDGYSQSGATANSASVGSNAVLRVVLDGSLQNSGHGLVLGGAGGSVVQGLVISGFNPSVNDNGDGIAVHSSNNIIRGNFIGTNAAGTAAAGNLNSGVYVGLFLGTATFTGNKIGGSLLFERNVISGNTVGITLTDDSSGTQILGNLIGTDKTGTAAIANTQTGIVNGGTGTVIGNGVTNAGNVISGNNNWGINTGGANTTIQGNLIGVNATGTAALPNTRSGVNFSNGATTALVGGNTTSLSNVISGNGQQGIEIGSNFGDGAGNNITVDGNKIGVGSDGTTAIGNGLDGIGVFATSGATINNNIIANNGGAGVLVSELSGPAAAVLIKVNSIFNNTNLGIDLQGPSDPTNGVTLNDAGDGDTGPNGLQNYPVISSVTGTQISGTLNSAVSATFTVDFYSNTAADASGFGEGRTYLGQSTVNTNTSGVGTFTFTPTATIAAGSFVTATATTATNSTSEFSAAVQLVAPSPFQVTTTLDTVNANDGVVSLREAIIAANGTVGTDTITFNIAGTGVKTITLTSALPTISGSVIIDGYTQPGASANTLAVGDNATLLIEINGANQSGFAIGAAGGGSTIRGLAINRVNGYGISISSDNNVIAGNFIGTDAAGSADFGNTRGGVQISSGVGNLIGGTTPAARNVISGNGPGFGADGNVLLGGGGTPTGTIIRGNYIGTNAAGTAAIQPSSSQNVYGIFITAGTNTIIGGADADDGSADGNVGARNLISGNLGGIRLDPTAAGIDGVTIAGNFIGVTASGTSALGNFSDGIFAATAIFNRNLVVGGTAAGAGNVISGNVGRGFVGGALDLQIQGNRIGTDLAGTLDLGNGDIGLNLQLGGSGTPNFQVTIGGATAAARNIISGNTGDGLQLTGLQSGTVAVLGNYIGTAADGVTALANNGIGVNINRPVQIGGTGVGEGNVIAFNGGAGVSISNSVTSVGSRISSNAIFSNGALGIDLGGNGVTPNDLGDSDTGSNNQQNFPVLTSASTSAGVTTVNGTFNGAANATLTLEFFRNTAADASGFGEGAIFLGSRTITTDATGNATFSYTPATAAAVGAFITATATDSANNTSEFSATRLVALGGPTTYTWDAGGVTDTNWFTAANWSPDGVPGAGDTAILNTNATITLSSANATVASFQQTTGTLTGTGTLTVLTSFAWTSGAQSGAGATTLPAGSTFTLGAGAAKTLTQRTLDVGGGGTMTAGESFGLASSATLQFSGGTFTMAGGNSFTGLGNVRLTGAGTTLTVNGAGVNFADNVSLLAEGGTQNGSGPLSLGRLTWGPTTFSGGAPIELRANGGNRLVIAGGGVLDGSTMTVGTDIDVNGGFTLANGAVINMSGFTNLNATATLASVGSGNAFNNLGTNIGNPAQFRTSGAPAVTVDFPFMNAAKVIVNGGSIAFNGGFTQNAGSTSMGGGAIASTAGMIFNGGDLLGAGTITGNVNNVGATVRPGDVNNPGAITITGNYTQGTGGKFIADLAGTSPALFDRLIVGGNATLDGTLEVRFFSGFTPAQNNSFRVVQSPNNPTTFTALTGQATGITQTADATGLLITQTGLSYVWDAGGGTDTSWFNPLNWVGDSGFPGANDSATLRINATTTVPSNHTVGALYHDIATSVGANSILSIPAGVTLTVRDNFTWNGGTESGGGTLTVAPGATFLLVSRAQPITLDGRTLNLNGTAFTEEPNQAPLSLANGATINNGGVLDFRGALSISGTGTFNNLAGATLKHTLSNTAVLFGNTITVTNAGTVRVETGLIQFGAGYTQTAGSSQLAGGQINGALALQGGDLTGVGNFNSNINNTGGIVRPGGAGAIGTLTTSGSYFQGAGGTLEVEIAGTAAGQFDVFTPGGFASVNGTLAAPLLGGFTPAAGNSFPVIGRAVSGTFASTPAGFTTQYNSTNVTLIAPVGGSPFVVTTSSDVVNASDGVTSLREAITAANATAGTDTISFNIPGTGVQTITVSTPLPTLTETVIIDGYTQPGSSANTLAVGDNAVLNIVIDGVNAGSTANGLVLGAGSNASTVRGLAIMRFGEAGLVLQSDGNSVLGNFLGLDAAGSVDMGNGKEGIAVRGGVGNSIGNATPAGRNVISGNGEEGIEIFGTGVSNTTVRDNYIGTDRTGTLALGNTFSGIVVAALGTTIGGTTAGSGNVISGNTLAGVQTANPGNNTTIQGNFLGVQADGVSPLGNLGNGVNLGSSTATSTLVGGPGGGNVIAYNGGNAGVRVPLGTGAVISANSIFSNTILGIDLGPIGVTANDALDVDTGANGLLNFPVLTSTTGGVISGSYSGAANQSFLIEFFSDSAGDASGFGEGRTYLGFTSVSTDSTGTAPFTFPSGVLPAGTAISATSTQTGVGTSEFSQFIVVPGSASSVVTTASDVVSTTDGVVSLREAIIFANSNAGTDTISFNIPGTGVQTITLSSVLPALTEAVIIDGYTQPGSSANTLATGNNAVLNIVLAGASNTIGNGLTIGSTATGTTVRGLVIQNFTDGIAVNGANAVITGNWIGVSAAGTVAAGSGDDGIQVGASGVRIGGTTPAERNVISGNSGSGIEMSGGFSGLTVQGNYIGTNAAGSTAIGNAGDGISLLQGATGNTIGGVSAGARNVISGNVSRGVIIFGDSNVVQGNYIGTDATGQIAVKNRFDGLTVAAPGSNNLIGGASTGMGNVISGNDISGVTIEAIGTVPNPATGNRVQGNLIGVAADGVTPLGNTAGTQKGWGVAFFRNATGNLIGGTAPGEANTIAFNVGAGVAVLDAGPVGNRISGNSIFSNNDLGIDLGRFVDPANSVLANDPGDADTGANDLINYPVLTSAVPGSSSTLISGTYNGIANQTFTIEFFANTTGDASGFGEGRTFLGATSVTTDSSGNGAFNFSATTLSIGTAVSATATQTAAGTSEFSRFILATGNSSTVVTTALDVVNANDGLVSLREAITFANSNSGLDTITFAIPGTGVKTILVGSPLPDITDPVVIDGYSQTGAAKSTNAVGAASNAVITIALDGSGITSGGGDGLRISSGGSTISGLAIMRFPGNGIAMDTLGGNTITGNFIGTNSTGTTLGGNGVNGVLIVGVAGNRIGGAAIGEGNVISGNGTSSVADIHNGAGVLIENSGATGNQVLGNLIGTNAAGTAALPNTKSGVAIYDNAGSNTVSGRNVISGNLGHGVDIAFGVSGNTVQGNFIGTNAAGTAPIGNTGAGVLVNFTSTNNLIGGTATGAGNVIGGNGLGGITIGQGSTGNRVVGNFVGTNSTGAAGLGNLAAGIVIGSAGSNTIGDATAPGAPNVIVANVGNGIEITGATAANNLVQNNFVGATPTTFPGGARAIPNTGAGIALLNGAHDNDIGGTLRANVISGNTGDGVLLNSANDNLVRGNRIGSVQILTEYLPNGGAGVHVINGTGNRIGSPLISELNGILHNRGAGILVEGNGAIVTARGNVLEGNGGLGIDINGDGDPSNGVTANDPGDGDTGPNTLINSPVLTTATRAANGSGYNYTVTGNYSGAPNTLFTIDLYASPAADPAGFGEAQFLIHTFSVTTDSAGNASYTRTFTGPTNASFFGVPVGPAITAQATLGNGTAGPSSEFSNTLGGAPRTSDAVFFSAQGIGSRVEIRKVSNGELVRTFSAFNPAFTGGVRIATGDVNGDGFNDVVTATGDGGGARVRVFDGHNETAGRPSLIFDFYAFGNAYRGGLSVAAGDVDGDGKADIIVAPSAGSSGLVKVFSGATGLLQTSFTAFGRGAGGVRVAAGDINGDGHADIIVGTSTGSGVRIFDGSDVSSVLKQFRAFPVAYRGGVTVASGDVNGDGLDDVIVGAARDSNAARIYFSGSAGTVTQFSAFGGAGRGINIGVIDANADGIADIIAAQGRGAAPKVRVFDGSTVTSSAPQTLLLKDVFTFNRSYVGGVFVS